MIQDALATFLCYRVGINLHLLDRILGHWGLLSVYIIQVFMIIQLSSLSWFRRWNYILIQCLILCDVRFCIQSLQSHSVSCIELITFRTKLVLNCLGVEFVMQASVSLSFFFLQCYFPCSLVLHLMDPVFAIIFSFLVFQVYLHGSGPFYYNKMLYVETMLILTVTCILGLSNSALYDIHNTKNIHGIAIHSHLSLLAGHRRW